MDRFDSMKALVSAVDEGGFAAAGRKLGLSRVQVSRLVGALEGHLGSQLLERTTRTMALTEAGQVFVERARLLVSQMEEAEAAAGESTDGLKGVLRVHAPVAIGASDIAPTVSDFMARHPMVSVSIVLNDRHVDPHEEGFDVSLYLGGQPPPAPLIARKLCRIRRLMCASPDYLEARGRPRTPDDLANHALLHFGHLTANMTWPVRGGGGNGRLPVIPVLTSNNGEVLKAAAIAGRGITLLPAFVVAGELANGDLAPVLEGFEPPPVTLYAAYPADLHRPAKTSAFVDFLHDRFKRRPPGGPV